MEGFKKAYPEIAIEFVRGPSGPLLTKVEQERATGAEGADVSSSTETGWFVARAKEGKLLKPVGPGLNGYPAKYILNGAVVVAAYEPAAIMYNKSLVKNPPKSYADLLRPEFKGRIGIADLSATLLIAWYDWLEKNEGADYSTKLKAQNPKIYVGSVPLTNATASGEIAVSAFTVPTATKPLMEQGAPIDYIIPSPAFGSQHVVSRGRGRARRSVEST